MTASENMALCYREFGPPDEVLRLEHTKVAPLKSGFARVRMLESPINPSDLIPITGAYRHRIGLPQIAGYEGVGVVVESAQAPELIGRRVLPLRGPGTWQRYVDAPCQWLVPVPDDIDTALASRGYINPLAALLMLKMWPVCGKQILVTAAGSACAQLLVQWAQRAGARKVVGIHRSPTHRTSIVRLGAQAVSMDDTAEVNAAAHSADLVFDAVGGSLAETLLSRMRPDAEFISYGLLSGETFAVPGAVFPQRFHIRDHLGAVSQKAWQQWFEDLWPMLRSAVLVPVSRFHLEDWRSALALFEASGRRVKPVLIFPPSPDEQ